MGNTKIEWAEKSWNPLSGCSPVSEGCANCYAERMAKRLAGRYGYPKDEPFRVTDHDDRFQDPIKWKKPRRIFVCSMGDLFHEAVRESDIGLVIYMMRRANWHSYMILTKRPQRMLHFFANKEWNNDHIWLGVSVENQKRADERIPILLQIPAKVRFVSAEPLLDNIDFSPWIGYNPIKSERREHNVPKTKRGNSLQGRREGRTVDRPTGTNLEINGEARRQMERGNTIDSLSEKKSRTRHGSIFPSAGDGQQETDSGPGPSCYLAAFQRPNPKRFNCESQKWEEKGQPPRKFGTGDILAPNASCESYFEDGIYGKSMGRDESTNEIDAGGRCGDSPSAANGRTIKNNSKGLRNSFPNSIKNSTGQPALSWIIAGCESGPQRRPAEIQWFRDIRDQCQMAGVPFFLKQMEIDGKVVHRPILDGKLWEEWPE